MKRYFTYVKRDQDYLSKPWMVKYQGEDYTVFTNSHSMALTSEPCEDLELLTGREKYPNVTRFIDYGGLKAKVDMSEVIQRAKDKGYRLSKKEVNPDFTYLLYYDNAYYKFGLFHATYSIIDDGGTAMVYHQGEDTSPLVISNRIGMCVVMPIKYYYDLPDTDETKVIIPLKETDI